MRILQIIDNMQLTGGAQKLQVLFAQTLKRRTDINLTVLSLQDDRQSPFTGMLEQAGACVVYFPGKSLVDLKRFSQLVQFIRQGGFDVVHTHLTYGNILGVTAAKINRVAVVTSLHNERIHKRRYYGIKNGAEMFLLRRVTNRVIAVGHSAADAYRQKLNGVPIHVIPNAIEMPEALAPEERIEMRTKLVGNPDHLVAISVGRLAAQKAFNDMITAFAQVTERFSEARLLIIGDGALRAALETQIAALNKQNNIQLLGLREDVPQLLAASDIFINSSLWEGLSMAMLEAMAAGLPVVATAVGDAPRLIVNGTGCLVPPEKPELLAEAISSFFMDPERMRTAGEAARRLVQSDYDPATWAQSILDVYIKAIRPDSSAALRSLV